MRGDEPVEGALPPELRPEERSPLRFPVPRRRLPEPAPTTLPLASGDLDVQAAAELRALKEQILEAVGFRCESYKEKCLRRRIAVRMRARGAHTYADYGRLLRTDGTEYGRLLDTLTINVSKFYRNPEVWETLEQTVLPELYGSRGARLNAWSAGCAGGEEPYSIAMLCHDYASTHGEDPDKHRILATDVDSNVLAFAQRGEYSSFAMTDIPDAVRARWFEPEAPFRVKPAVKRHVTFEKLDLLQDAFPQKQHLIFCRNVIIYFERPLQEELFRRFHAALVPGGFLVLGKVEALFGSAAGMFRTVSARQRVFQKS